MESMIKEKNVFDGLYHPQGMKVTNDYEIVDNGTVIFDHASGLMWQQSGSGQIAYRAIKKWVTELNKKRFAGYSDWRLPTIEEVLTLLETKKKGHGLYIDPIFDETQSKIWTADVHSKTCAWAMFFNEGHCYYSDTHQMFTAAYYYLRAVR